MAAPIVIHVGYPKTATSTFQLHVFPHHPEIEYLGKFIPSYRYCEEETYDQIDALLHRSELRQGDMEPLSTYLESVRIATSRKVVLLSSESFIHPSTIDLATVAKRLKEVVGEARILITIREQIGAILSFYWMHGRHGEYLSIAGRDQTNPLIFPLSFSEWIAMQMDAFDKNYLATLHYFDVIQFYVGIFGRENVHVLLYETLARSPDLYAEMLGCALGVDVKTIRELMDGVHEHLSMNRRTPWTQKDIQDLYVKRRRFLGLFPEKSGAYGFVPSDDRVIASLRDLYRPGNQRLIEDYKLPIDTNGYEV